MAARSRAKPTRQFKTLATLVFSMTFGTFVLSWIHDLSPSRTRAATALRSVQSGREFDQLIVQSVPPSGLLRDGSVRAFHHLHVDRAGRVIESHAWKNREHDPHAPGAVQIAVSVDDASGALTPRQWRRLADLMTRLQQTYGIGWDRVSSRSYSGGDVGRRQQEHLDAMIRTR